MNAPEKDIKPEAAGEARTGCLTALWLGALTARVAVLRADLRRAVADGDWIAAEEAHRRLIEHEIRAWKG